MTVPSARAKVMMSPRTGLPVTGRYSVSKATRTASMSLKRSSGGLWKKLSEVQWQSWLFWTGSVDDDR